MNLTMHGGKLFQLTEGLWNWGRYHSLDISRNGQSPRPSCPVTSKDYRAHITESDNEPPPDEQWALEIQQAIVRLEQQDEGTAYILKMKYREGCKIPKGRLRLAKYMLWRVL